VLGIARAPSGTIPSAILTRSDRTSPLPSEILDSPVLGYHLALRFQSAFDGDDSDTARHDAFQAFLTDLSNDSIVFSTVLQTSAPFPDCGPDAGCANNQVTNNPFSTLNSGLPPSNYRLEFVLMEGQQGGPNTTATAAGVDSVSIVAEASLSIPSPATVVLLGLGLTFAALIAGAPGLVRKRTAAPRGCARVCSSRISARTRDLWLPLILTSKSKPAMFSQPSSVPIVRRTLRICCARSAPAVFCGQPSVFIGEASSGHRSQPGSSLRRGDRRDRIWHCERMRHRRLNGTSGTTQSLFSNSARLRIAPR
jgi:hypothetical protein